MGDKYLLNRECEINEEKQQQINGRRKMANHVARNTMNDENLRNRNETQTL